MSEHEGPRRWIAALGLALLAVVAAPAAAGGTAGRGPHETVASVFRTSRPGAASGSIYDVTYHNPNDPSKNPPSVRRVAIVSPRGTRIDTSVPARCEASDAELKARGDSACPERSRIGAGTVTLSVLGGPPSTSQISVFNTDHGAIQLVRFGSFGASVVRSRISGRTITTDIPTCVSGGQPPRGCPFDQAAVLASRVVFRKITVYGRSYLTTPSGCPRGGWPARITDSYGDGAVETVVSVSACKRPPRAAPPEDRGPDPPADP